MIEMLKLMSSILNEIHDILIRIFKQLGFSFNDKELHFIIIGIIGMVLYLIVNAAFKKIVKLSVEVISFIYTATVLLVLVFAIEIAQKITGGGVMEFEDVVAGVWGFIYIFAVYLAIRMGKYLTIKGYKYLIRKKDVKVNNENK
ncbi:hypothetical protein [Clostridium grantii]|nr:hypothetical protein [Clostridium grantii]